MQRILQYLPLCLALVLVPLMGQAQVATQATLVVFCAMPNGAPSIFIAPSNGTGKQRLLIPNASWPAVSPDGSKLAFVRGQDIYLANFDGSGIRAITNHAATVQVAHPAFNAAGNALVFALGAPNAPFAVETVNLDGSGETTVAANGLDPIYTPDGAAIVFAYANNIEMMALPRPGVQGFQPTPIASQGPTAVLRFPAFSPRTAFSAYSFAQTPGAVPSICLLSYGGGQRQTTVWQTNATEPAFSPDGTRIAFMREGDIYVASVKGGAAVRITSGGVNSEPVWLK
jgi:Tol biopolymer transport system component